MPGGKRCGADEGDSLAPQGSTLDQRLSGGGETGGGEREHQDPAEAQLSGLADRFGELGLCVLSPVICMGAQRRRLRAIFRPRCGRCGGRVLWANRIQIECRHEH
jgi:hypothetical protein